MNKKEERNMYSKVDLIENEKMNEIIRKNRIKMQKVETTRVAKTSKKVAKKEKLMFVIAMGILIFGIVYFALTIQKIFF